MNVFVGRRINMLIGTVVKFTPLKLVVEATFFWVSLITFGHFTIFIGADWVFLLTMSILWIKTYLLRHFSEIYLSLFTVYVSLCVVPPGYMPFDNDLLRHFSEIYLSLFTLYVSLCVVPPDYMLFDNNIFIAVYSLCFLCVVPPG